MFSITGEYHDYKRLGEEKAHFILQFLLIVHHLVRNESGLKSGTWKKDLTHRLCRDMLAELYPMS